MVLSEVVVEIVRPEEEGRFRELMQSHHYLGAVAKIGETLWYVAHLDGAWLALAVFSAPALKCRARDTWVGWDFRYQYGRLHLVSNNTRLLILPGHHYRNLGSRVLGLCARRIVGDPARFGHPLRSETLSRTLYRGANWQEVGHSRGFRRDGAGYGEVSTPKRVFLYPLARDVRQLLSGATLAPTLRKGAPKTMLSAAQMRSLPDFFTAIDDPRTRKGRRHPLHSTLALAAAATLCGARGYKAIWEWVDARRQSAGGRRRNGVRKPPCQSTIRIDPRNSTARCNAGTSNTAGRTRRSDGKTLRNAVDEQGMQAHVMSVVGRHEGHLHPKKVGLKPGADDDTKRTNEIGTVIPLLDQIEDISGKTLTADALLTQRKLATYLLERNADYLFTVKNNQPTAARYRLATRQTAQNRPPSPTDASSGAIWTSTDEYVNFPGVGQVCSGAHGTTKSKTSIETVYGVTSHTPENPEKLLTLNRAIGASRTPPMPRLVMG